MTEKELIKQVEDLIKEVNERVTKENIFNLMVIKHINDPREAFREILATFK